ncbi:MFS transporter [Methanobacterium alcaliphilum]|uniref:MFS transporter n=1 Tax=Methanobacterium alcaliphilum TaxID=392018 RepID=UPI00200A0C73|nr:MFS transporter [Methanobacterium alcaliphilum]MCK9151362.1 MFS transporter [Methanobacterium alcaliphilum]
MKLLEKLRNNQKLTIIIICLASFMGFFDISIVNVSLPTIAHHFSIDVSIVTWVVLIYVLALSSFLIAFGSLAERIGYKKVYLTGFLVFIIGSFLCGISATFNELILFRFIQATGAAMFSALTAAMVANYLPSKNRGLYMGYVATFASLGFAFGPVIGGYITQFLSWNWIFFINVPIGIIGIFLGISVLQEVKNKEISGKFDYVGVILLFIAQATLIFALNRGLALGWTSYLIMGTVLTAIICWILFIWRESRYIDPILNLKLLKNKHISIPTASNFFFNMPNAGVMVLFPFYLELVKGIEVSQVGLVLAIMPLAVLIVGPIAGKLSDKSSPNKITALGALVGIISLLLLSTLDASSSMAYIGLSVFLVGASVALYNPPNMKFIMGESPKKMRGVTSGIVTTARMTANAFGVAILQSVAVIGIYLAYGVVNKSHLTPDQIVHGFSSAYLAGAVIIVIALVLILFVKEENN